MSEQFFLDRDSQRRLVVLLREIPGLIEDLAVTLTRQARIGASMRIQDGTDDQPLPFDVGASDASETLRTELWTWIRVTCESRGMAYSGPTSTLGLARWLDEHVTSLAMTEGSEEALRGIEWAMSRVRRAMDLPPEKSRPPVDEEKLARARDLELNARACVAIARTLGDEYLGLTQRRVKTLLGNQLIASLRTERAGRERWNIYRLGDVLDAHLALATRGGRIGA